MDRKIYLDDRMAPAGVGKTATADTRSITETERMMFCALQVIRLTENIRAFLQANDPVALEQVEFACIEFETILRGRGFTSAAQAVAGG